jgi:hypothetical protein
MDAGVPRLSPSSSFGNQTRRSTAKRSPAVAEVIDLLDNDDEVQEVVGPAGGASVNLSTTGNGTGADVFSRWPTFVICSFMSDDYSF